MVYGLAVDVMLTSGKTSSTLMINSFSPRSGQERLDGKSLNDVQSSVRGLSSSDKVSIEFLFTMDGMTSKERNWYREKRTVVVSPNQVVSTINRAQQAAERAQSAGLEIQREANQEIQKKQQEIRTLQRTTLSDAQRAIQRSMSSAGF